jgi:hypothetical protein
MTLPLKDEDWRVIAAQASKENDPEKLSRLVAQLCESFDERDKSRKDQQAKNAAVSS